jgi:hypothetical protein
MIISNCDGLDVSLRDLNQQASSQFLYGGAAFHELLAALEKTELPVAASSAVKASELFDGAVRSFSVLAKTLRSPEYGWIGDATREIDFDDAARTVHLSPDSDLVRRLNGELTQGNLYKVFALFSERVAGLSGEITSFAGRASGANVILDDEYRLAHRLLRDWSAMIAEGQYISSVCLAAATRRTVTA